MDVVRALTGLLVIEVGLASGGVLDWGKDNRLEVHIPWLPSVSVATNGFIDWSEEGIGINPNWVQIQNETRCYGQLGCLQVSRYWYHLIYRPLNPFPLPRDIIDTKFILYTRKNMYQGHILKPPYNITLQNSRFDAKKPTKLIVHGFIDSPLSNWIKDMRLELLKHSDMNVVVVDWASGSLPLYTQAMANTRLVGLEIAYFINYLKDHNGLNPRHVHIIGHSLGAHTAGYAGERIKGLGRITGLDPADPYFQGMPPFVRLDPSDAEWVDVMHTDGTSILLLGYGMDEPCGDADFYPNNGKLQPGCEISENPVPLTLVREGLEEASRVLVACSHVRALKLFTESINSDCHFIGRKCSSHEQYQQGKCFECGEDGLNCAVMGFATTKARRMKGSNYYVTTGGSPPYCRREYKVKIEFAKPEGSSKWVQGYLRLSLFSDRGSIKNVNLTPNGGRKFYSGTTGHFVFSHMREVGDVQRAEIYWEYDMSVLRPRSICILWCNDHLYISRVKIIRNEVSTVWNAVKDVSQTLCTKGKERILDLPSKATAVFWKKCD